MQGLQVIAGRYKGRKIYTSQNNTYRPTKSRVRKSLFDHLGQLNGLKFADLFSGSGIMGLEAASRGTTKVYLVENDRKNIKDLSINLEKLGVTGIELLEMDVFRFLKNNYTLDMIFADPPYEWFSDVQIKEKIIPLIESSLECISEKGLFILESPAKAQLWPDYEKSYGDTKLNFWSKKCIEK